MRLSLLLVAALLASCGTEAGAPERIPSADDFADFLAWERTPIESTDRFEHAIYTNALARQGTEGGEGGLYALGSAFVRAEESGPHQTWFLHGMAFRGGAFNAGHARGWEFFGLYMDERSAVHVIWRGDHPPLGAGYVEPDAGAFDAGPFGLDPGDCRGCHRDPDAVIPF